MMTTLLEDREELLVKRGLPSLSHSRVNRYLHCPEQYRLYYIENLRPKLPQASLVFGQAVHQALAALLGKQGDPVKCFLDLWDHLKGIELGYRERESWDKLRASGEALLRKFVSEELPKLSAIRAVEKAFELSITSLETPFVGIIDLVAEVNRKATVVDFKTSATGLPPHEVALSDQLTAYKLADPQVEQLALCVLVKTKEPRIEWQFADRSGQQLTEYLAKVGYVAHEIKTGHFYKRSGLWCTWCDFLPVCLENQKKVEETLVRIQ
jgi:RecB family exonuclease